MGLFGNLFGSGKTAQFNKTVDTIIRDDYGVEIDSTVNSKFPGIIKYRAMTDEVKYDNASPEAAALCVLIPYYGGIVKSDSPAVQAEACELIDKDQAEHANVFGDWKNRAREI